ncbi:hypothetical protein [Palleronia sp. LCG004]|uniref:hypothetical protein n=1 Tax=Palleronia sp. LCG004 TaxID=3079304 RepID=UPI00294369CD|nr:hypothetical protein [Palleronia sp. LCG004]WOI56603.1 hypothetical protein RVY76_02045 [Palleronia sp. LCG004]
MVVLRGYERLEASGLWTEAPGTDPRDVIVSLGDATISITDMSERPLTHWSLPATERQNPGEMPAIFAPGPDAAETLELDDTDMIEAIETVHRVIARHRPRHGWVRSAILGVILAALLAGGVLWLPGALVRHAASVAPPAVRADTGLRLLREITLIEGEPCQAEAARQPLAELSRRVLGPGGGQIVVLPDGPRTAEHLPGNIVLLDRTLVEDSDGPEAVAGYVVAELARAEAVDPIARLLEHAGPGAAVNLLTRGEIPDIALADYAQSLLSEPQDPLSAEIFLEKMEEARIPATPYAEAREAAGESMDPLIEADPVTAAEAEPVLPAGEWRALQQICAG